MGIWFTLHEHVAHITSQGEKTSKDDHWPVAFVRIHLPNSLAQPELVPGKAESGSMAGSHAFGDTTAATGGLGWGLEPADADAGESIPNRLLHGGW